MSDIVGASIVSGNIQRLINKQTPKWINILMLIFTAIILVFTIYIAFFK